MAERKKPSGKAWEELVSRYQRGSHIDKLELAKQCGVTYDSLRHWMSEGATTPVEHKPVEVPPEPFFPAEVKEILQAAPQVHLDFVSFDVETSNLKADFSIVLSAVIKPYGQPPMVFRGDNYSNWKTNRADDSPIVQDITKELAKHAIVITHYGSKFDLPYIRAKMMKCGLPKLPPMFGVDTYKIAKVNMAVGSRRLEALARYFELGQKSTVEGGLWNEAALNGDKKAMDSIVDHNVQDCCLLESLAAILFPYMRSIPRA